jgi:hypothetical protein
LGKKEINGEKNNNMKQDVKKEQQGNAVVVVSKPA